MAIKDKIKEIESAADNMIPIKDIHLGRDLKKLANEVEQAQEVMYGRHMSDKELIHKMEKSFVENNSEPIIFIDSDKVIKYMNTAAILKYEAEGGADLIGKDADALDGELVELRDDLHVVIGWYVK